jgi:hypothetical protein
MLFNFYGIATGKSKIEMRDEPFFFNFDDYLEFLE